MKNEALSSIDFFEMGTEAARYKRLMLFSVVRRDYAGGMRSEIIRIRKSWWQDKRHGRIGINPMRQAVCSTRRFHPVAGPGIRCLDGLHGNTD